MEALLPMIDLKSKRNICPQLFQVNHNIINDPNYLHLHLNLAHLESLQKEFPGINFEIIEYIEIFASSTTFYPISDRSNLQ